MLHRLLLIFAIVSVSLQAAADSVTPIPNTPAGKTLRAWLDAFNSGDRTRMEAFVHDYQPQDSADGMAAFHSTTGNLQFLSIQKVERSRIVFLVLQKATSKTVTGIMDLTNSTAPQIRKLNFIGLEQLTPNAESLRYAFH